MTTRWRSIAAVAGMAALNVLWFLMCTVALKIDDRVTLFECAAGGGVLSMLMLSLAILSRRTRMSSLSYAYRCEVCGSTPAIEWGDGSQSLKLCVPCATDAMACADGR